MATPDTDYYSIGFTSGSMGLLSALGVSAPKSTFTPYAAQKTMVSGAVRGVGWPVASWNWGIITRAERDILRGYCPGASATVYIRTKTMDSSDAFHIYKAVMVWPTQEEQRDFQRRLTFKIDFRALELIS